jgi:hypothetical protein
MSNRLFRSIFVGIAVMIILVPLTLGVSLFFLLPAVASPTALTTISSDVAGQIISLYDRVERT